jgi:hypothetical protein
VIRRRIELDDPRIEHRRRLRGGGRRENRHDENEQQAGTNLTDSRHIEHTAADVAGAPRPNARLGPHRRFALSC